MDLVFNELSVQFDLPTTEQTVINCFEQMYRILVKYRQAFKHPSANILSNTKFSDCTLIQDYSIDLKTIFKQLPNDVQSLLIPAITSQPMLREIPPYYYHQYNEESLEVKGFAYAYENNLYAISYNNLVWGNPNYTLLKIDEVIEENVQVNHFIENSIDALGEDTVYESLNSSEELWIRRKDIFPNLVFCKETEKQICSCSIKNKLLRTSYQKLKVLNDGIGGKPLNEFNYKNLGIAISGESESTLNKYSKERTFSIPETEREEIFELHIKSGDWRYHFYLDNETNMCYIGYIGVHLPT